MPYQCRIVHSIRGRLRIRCDGSGALVDACEGVAGFLRGQPGVTGVRANPSCRSIVITYDPAQQSVESLVHAVRTASPEHIQSGQTPQTTPDSTQAPEVAWLPLALSSAALAFGFLAEAALAPWLVLGAAIPLSLIHI